MRSKFSKYVLSLRPWSFSASFMPVAVGCTLACKSNDSFSIVIFLVTGLTALTVHGAGNVVNTYYDYMKGIDSKKRSDDRTLVDKILTPDELVHLGAFLYLLGCLGFVVLCLISPAKMEHLALVYFGGLSASFVYTGGGLKYIGLGDVVVLVTFGPMTVLFAYMAQTGTADLSTLYYGMPLALNTEAILHSNNTRDMESDRSAGIMTVAIMVGQAGSHILFSLLLFAPYIAFTVMSLHHSRWFLLPLLTLVMAFNLERKFRQGNLQNLPNETTRLNFYFGVLYLMACIMAPVTDLPGIQAGL